MSRADVDLVRSIYAAWARGDYSSTEWAHPDIEFVIADGPATGRWSGLAGLAEGWRGLASALKDPRTEAEDCRELTGGQVLVLVHRGGREDTSPFDPESARSKGADLFRLRDGKVTDLVVYLDRERALGDLRRRRGQAAAKVARKSRDAYTTRSQNPRR